MDSNAILSLLEQLQELLLGGRLTRYLGKAQQLVRCWEVLACNRKRCPAYGNLNVRCWQLVGTMCAEHCTSISPHRTKWNEVDPVCRTKTGPS